MQVPDIVRAPYARVRPLVSAWKEHGLRGLASLAAAIVDEVIAPPPVQLITFVPPDGDRSVRRGYHPAARLACYAQFHAAKALFFERTARIAKTHKGVSAQFHRICQGRALDRSRLGR